MFTSQMFNVDNKKRIRKIDTPTPEPEPVDPTLDPKEPLPPVDTSGGKTWGVKSWRPTKQTKLDGSGLLKSTEFVGSTRDFERISEECKAEGIMWNDPDFPANADSVFGFGEKPGYSKYMCDKLIWLRPGDIYKEEKFSVYDEIGPNDIKQGDLGDCYFLSALSAIAEHTERIKRIFLQREVNETGVYCVGFYLNGTFEEVVIDDQFPCSPYTDSPWANSSQEKELWVMI